MTLTDKKKNANGNPLRCYSAVTIDGRKLTGLIAAVTAKT